MEKGECRLEVSQFKNMAQMQKYYSKEIARLRTALDKLARLGNEPNYGNSIGNDIARKALENHND